MYLNVDNRELATILAALRLWQEQDAPPARQLDIATDCGDLDPLRAEEIDALCESINGDDELPARLVAALERASAACESHNAGGKVDYDWIGKAEETLDAAYAAGLGPKVSNPLKRLIMAEIDNEAVGGDSPVTLAAVKDSLDSGYRPYSKFPVGKVRQELADLIARVGPQAGAKRFLTDADWKARAETTKGI